MYESKLKLYNEDAKLRFLDSLTNSPSTKLSYKRYLKSLSRYEWKINKDLYELTLAEIFDMFSALQTASEETTSVMLTILKKYRQWAMKEGLMSSLIDDAIALSKGDLKRIISKTKYRNKYFKNFEQLKDVIDFCINFQDKVLFILPYYGIDGKEHSEMTNLKLSDCDFENDTIKVSRNDSVVTISIPHEFMEYIEKAAKEYEYRQNNGIKDKHKEKYSSLCITNYVLRPAEISKIRAIDKLKDNETFDIKEFKIQPQIINQRIGKIAKGYYTTEPGIIENREKLNPQNILWSGVFHTLYNKEQQDRLTNEDIGKVCNIYDLSTDINNICDVRNKYETFKEILL